MNEYSLFEQWIMGFFQRDPNRKKFLDIIKPKLTVRDGIMFLLFFISTSMYFIALITFFLTGNLGHAGVATAIMFVSFWGFCKMSKEPDFERGKLS